jgi:pyruvate/2-oxoglutarate dehydrogenase complex dihydrolipoamide dehydrogenase (E3) component
VNPDAVAIATGATEHVPDVSGIDAAHVSTAFAAMALPPPPSAHVAVVGGLDDHLPPLTVACHLATRVRRVTLISEQLAPGEGVEAATRLALMKRLLDRGVAIQALSRLTAVGDGTLTLTNTLTRTTTTLEGIDAVVLACGRRARVGLADALTDQGRDVTVIGDALSPRRLLHATLDGARWGSAI